MTSLAKYYRFLNKETAQNIALAAEVEHMQHYIEIQQMRFGEMIHVDMQNLPEEVASLRVPKLILQPVVENAYNYGLKNTLSEGKIWIRYRVEVDFLHIDIEDNGGNMDEGKVEILTRQINSSADEARNHALANIHRRLQLSYGPNCGIQLRAGKENGLCVSLVFDRKSQL